MDISHTGGISELVRIASFAEVYGISVAPHNPYGPLRDLVRPYILRRMKTDKTVIADVLVDQAENCFPMIPSGAAHNEMLFGPEDKGEQSGGVTEEGMVLV